MISLEYRQGWIETGDIIDPTAFVEDVSRLAGMVNGGLTRDNFAESDLVASEVSGTPFDDVHNVNTDTPYAVTRTTTEWQGPAANGASGVGYVSWVSTQPAHYDVHWSGEWEWNPASAYSHVTAGARPNRTDTFDTIQVRVSIDGIVLFTLGPFEDGMLNGSAYGVGAIQLPAGTHTMLVQVKVARREVQTALEDGICTNTVEMGPRTVLAVERMR